MKNKMSLPLEREKEVDQRTTKEDLHPKEADTEATIMKMEETEAGTDTAEIETAEAMTGMIGEIKEATEDEGQAGLYKNTNPSTQISQTTQPTQTMIMWNQRNQ